MADRSVSKTILSWLTRRDTGRDLALKIAGVYVVIGVSWCLFDHELTDPEFTKDVIVYLVTAALLFWLIRHGVDAIRKTESALRDSEERLARILETNASGIVVVDPDGRITYLNLMGAAILGMPRTDAVGLYAQQLRPWIVAADGTPVADEELPFARILRTGEPVTDVEMTVQPPGKPRVILSVNAAPFLDGQGKVIGMVASFSDITERKMAQDMNLRKLSLAVVQSPVGIVLADASGRIEYVNPQFSAMTGFDASEIRRKHLADFTGHSPSGVSAPIRSAITEGKGWAGRFTDRRRSGEPYWVSASLTPNRNAQGILSGFLWIMEDVTERRSAEEAVRESEERFRELFLQNEEPILLFRAGTTRIVDANPAAVRLYGYAPEELIERGPALFVPPASLSEFEAMVRAIGEESVLNVENAVHRRRGGDEIIVSVRGHAIKLPGGAVSFCTFRDITARVRLEEEARRTQAQLIHANRMAALGTVVSGVAHEINNPNNLVMFNTPIIEAAWKDFVPVLERYHREHGEFSVCGIPFSEMRDAIPRLLHGISDGALRIKNIVGNLKDFTRPTKTVAICLVDVNDVVRKAIGILNHEILRGTHNFRVEYAENVPPARGCVQELEQVVVNLVNNSLQAIPGPWAGIRVVTAADGGEGWVSIVVRDEGRGMTKDILGKVAEPFFTTRHEAGGLGLGLSISQAIVKEHGGTLTFESEPGKGTTATVRIPCLSAPVEETVGPTVSRRT